MMRGKRRLLYISVAACVFCCCALSVCATDAYSRSYASLRTADERVWTAVRNEAQRQRRTINLIASENYVSPAVLQVLNYLCGSFSRERNLLGMKPLA